MKEKLVEDYEVMTTQEFQKKIRTLEDYSLIIKGTSVGRAEVRKERQEDIHFVPIRAQRELQEKVQRLQNALDRREKVIKQLQPAPPQNRDPRRDRPAENPSRPPIPMEKGPIPLPVRPQGGKNSKCFKCGGSGHFANNCTNKQTEEGQEALQTWKRARKALAGAGVAMVREDRGFPVNQYHEENSRDSSSRSADRSDQQENRPIPSTERTRSPEDTKPNIGKTVGDWAQFTIRVCNELGEEIRNRSTGTWPTIEVQIKGRRLTAGVDSFSQATMITREWSQILKLEPNGKTRYLKGLNGIPLKTLGTLIKLTCGNFMAEVNVQIVEELPCPLVLGLDVIEFYGIAIDGRDLGVKVQNRNMFSSFSYPDEVETVPMNERSQGGWTEIKTPVSPTVPELYHRTSRIPLLATTTEPTTESQPSNEVQPYVVNTISLRSQITGGVKSYEELNVATLQCFLNGYEYRGLVDTSSEVTTIRRSIVEEHGWEMKSFKKDLIGFQGTSVRTVGLTWVTLICQNGVAEIGLQVAEDPNWDLVLGNDMLNFFRVNIACGTKVVTVELRNRKPNGENPHPIPCILAPRDQDPIWYITETVRYDALYPVDIEVYPRKDEEMKEDLDEEIEEDVEEDEEEGRIVQINSLGYQRKEGENPEERPEPNLSEIHVEIEGFHIAAIVDSAAEMSTISEDLAIHLKLKIERNNTRLVGFSGEVVKAKGMVFATITSDMCTLRMYLLVLKKAQHQLSLGNEAIENMHIDINGKNKYVWVEKIQTPEEYVARDDVVEAYGHRYPWRQRWTGRSEEWHVYPDPFGTGEPTRVQPDSENDNPDDGESQYDSEEIRDMINERRTDSEEVFPVVEETRRSSTPVVPSSTPKVSCYVGSYLIRARVDSGSDVSIISQDLAERLKIEPKIAGRKIRGFDGKIVESLFAGELEVQISRGRGTLMVHVIPASSSTFLLGIDALWHFKFVLDFEKGTFESCLVNTGENYAHRDSSPKVVPTARLDRELILSEKRYQKLILKNPEAAGELPERPSLGNIETESPGPSCSGTTMIPRETEENVPWVGRDSVEALLSLVQNLGLTTLRLNPPISPVESRPFSYLEPLGRAFYEKEMISSTHPRSAEELGSYIQQWNHVMTILATCIPGFGGIPAYRLKVPQTEVSLNGISTTVILDTGAEISVMRTDFAESRGYKRLPCTGRVYGVNQEVVVPDGEVLVTVRRNKCWAQVYFRLLRHAVCDVILGTEVLKYFEFSIDFNEYGDKVTGRKVNMKLGDEEIGPAPILPRRA
jgi:gag-polyprotein putative aspartyl protease/Aspartyl protease/Zinc knuckle